MKKVYFAGSISGGRDFTENYFEIINYLKNNFIVLTEHVGDKKLGTLGETKKSDEEIYERDCEFLRESDFVVAEVSNPSLGVGYEIGYAERLGKPILCLCVNNGRRISAMIRGNKYLSVYSYKEIEDIKNIIDNFTKNNC